MVPDSMRTFFEVNRIGEEDQEQLIKLFLDHGYLEIGGAAWGEIPESTELKSVEINWTGEDPKMGSLN